jgi:UPF0755 protein
MLKKVLLLSLFLLLLLAAASWKTWDRYTVFLQTPLTITEQGQLFQLQPGMSGVDIVQQMSRLEMTIPGWEWRLLMRMEPHVYRAGEYQLTHGMLPQQALAELAGGRVVQYRITLVEGWSFRQFAAAITANDVLRHEMDLEAPAQWPALAERLGVENLEGWFLPETYQFTRGDSDIDVLDRAHAAMKQALDRAWAARGPELPIESSYELLILASIIEKETALDAERDQVAGVFVRRLNKRMRLQTDPTVIYGMGETYDGNIRRRDLQTDTPYNTYTRHGLPPTPIAMPGTASLMAAAQPAAGDSFYFVADGNGGHTFSNTLEEHQKAVRKLIERN